MAADDFAITAIVAAGGTATITIRPTGRQTWTLQQVGVRIVPLPAGAKCQLTKNGIQVTPIILADTGGAAGGEPPLKLSPADTAKVEFTGCTAGQIVSCFGIYDDGQ